MNAAEKIAHAAERKAFETVLDNLNAEKPARW